MDPITNFCGPWCFMPDFVLANRVLTPAEKLVYCGIARRTRLADDRPEAWPGLEDIAKHTGLSRATVHKAVKALVAEGLIQKTHQHRPDGGLTSNRYTLLPIAERAEAALSTPPCTPDTTPVQILDDPRPIVGPEADTLKQIEGPEMSRSKTRSTQRPNGRGVAPLASMEEPQDTSTAPERGDGGVSVDTGGAVRQTPSVVAKALRVESRGPTGQTACHSGAIPSPEDSQRTVLGAAASSQGPGAGSEPASPPQVAQPATRIHAAPGPPPPPGPRRVMYDGDLPPDDPPPRKPRSPKQQASDALIRLGKKMADLWEERVKPACGLPGASTRKAGTMRKAAQAVLDLKEIAPELLEDHDELIRRLITEIARCNGKIQGLCFDMLFPGGNLAKLLNQNWSQREETVRFKVPGKEQDNDRRTDATGVRRDAE